MSKKEMYAKAWGVLVPISKSRARVHRVLSATCIEIVGPDGFINRYALEPEEVMQVSGERVANPNAGKWTPMNPMVAGEYEFIRDPNIPTDAYELEAPIIRGRNPS